MAFTDQQWTEREQAAAVLFKPVPDALAEITVEFSANSDGNDERCFYVFDDGTVSADVVEYLDGRIETTFRFMNEQPDLAAARATVSSLAAAVAAVEIAVAALY